MKKLQISDREIMSAAIKKPGTVITGSGLKIILGSVLLSHLVSQAVPSALKSLTSVFGMGTGVSSLPSPPRKMRDLNQKT